MRSADSGARKSWYRTIVPSHRCSPGLVLALILGCAGSRVAETSAPASAPPPDVRGTNGSNFAYPETRTEEISEPIFGLTVNDPYRWLEDEKAPEVQAWMSAEDQLARQALSKLPGRDGIAARLREVLYVETVNPPVHRGNRLFYARRRADQEKAAIYYREGQKGKDQLLLDPNTLSPDGSISVHGWLPSLDGNMIAYTLHKNNADYGTLHVLDVASRRVSERDVIDDVRSPGSWTPNADGFYYTHFPASPRISAADRLGEAIVRFHRLGTDPAGDPVVYGKTGNAQRFPISELSRDGHWLTVTIAKGTEATDVYFRDARKRDAPWVALAVSESQKKFGVAAWKDRFYVYTNDGAPNFRVYQVDPKHPERGRWKEIVREDARATLEAVSVVGNRLSLVYLRDVKSEIELRTLDGAPLRKLNLPGLGYGAIAGEPGQDDAYLTFSSLTQPPTIYRTSIRSGHISVWFSLKVPIDFAPYQTEQVWFTSKDGARVPMFVVHRKDLRKDGTTPFLLGGYGGFNIPMVSRFSAALFPWLEAGGGFALPNLRGGGEFGEAWHEAGMLAKKQNVFDDFIAAAEYLVNAGYTQPARLAIRGGSNGGLLVGAAMTQRPELFRAVVCAVPLLDMVRYHLFGLGKLWIPEYGSAENEEQFKVLYAYSPYHHVHRGTSYPALLMLSADSDDRVDPVHARKVTAALQAATSSSRPIWLRIEHQASHGGADLVRQTVEQSADTYAFLIQQLGMTPPGKSLSDASR
jgi:prolyl oligopeptidase